jgi:hypothetical protein
MVARDEIIKWNWFDLANQTIAEAEQEGRTRDALIMKGKLNSAQRAWEDEDFTGARNLLEQIAPIPEALSMLILVTLAVLGLARQPTVRGQ